MSEFEDFYRENILDHYKNPRNYGLLEPSDAHAEGLGEVGIPLTPVRMKCASLGLGVVKVALNRSKGTPLPEEWQGLDID